MYIPTVNESRKKSVNLLHSTQPMSLIHREYITSRTANNSVQKTEVFEQKIQRSQVRIDLDSPDRPGARVRFDAKNEDDAFPKENGEYIPVLRYLNDKRH